MVDIPVTLIVDADISLAEEKIRRMGAMPTGGSGQGGGGGGLGGAGGVLAAAGLGVGAAGTGMAGHMSHVAASEAALRRAAETKHSAVRSLQNKIENAWLEMLGQPGAQAFRDPQTGQIYIRGGSNDDVIRNLQAQKESIEKAPLRDFMPGGSNQSKAEVEQAAEGTAKGLEKFWRKYGPTAIAGGVIGYGLHTAGRIGQGVTAGRYEARTAAEDALNNHLRGNAIPRALPLGESFYQIIQSFTGSEARLKAGVRVEEQIRQFSSELSVRQAMFGGFGVNRPGGTFPELARMAEMRNEWHSFTRRGGRLDEMTAIGRQHLEDIDAEIATISYHSPHSSQLSYMKAKRGQMAEQLGAQREAYATEYLTTQRDEIRSMMATLMANFRTAEGDLSLMAPGAVSVNEQDMRITMEQILTALNNIESLLRDGLN